MYFSPPDPSLSQPEMKKTRPIFSSGESKAFHSSYILGSKFGTKIKYNKIFLGNIVNIKNFHTGNIYFPPS